MKAEDLEIGGNYKFIHDDVKLTYIGYNFSGNGYWHQFEKTELYESRLRAVWCEVLDDDLHLLEPINKE